MQSRPLVGVTACRREVEGHPAHTVTDKYLAALRDYGLAPVILPGVRPAAIHSPSRVRVNSLHQQGIATLGLGLEVEAVAPDGLIEAISVRDASGFAMAVQWHPEWRTTEHPLYDALFQAFAGSCCDRHSRNG